MSAYTTRVLQDNPVFYFAVDNSTVNNLGSVTPTISTGSGNTFYTTGGVKNSGYYASSSETSTSVGFSYSPGTQSPGLLSDKTFTISGWYKVASADVSSNSNYIFKTITVAGISEGIYLNYSGSIFTVGANFGSAYISTTVSSPFDVWTHFALVGDGTYLYLYINGIQKASTTFSGTVTSGTLTHYWTQYYNSGGNLRRGAKGRFDELAIFNSALSGTTLLEHYSTVASNTYSATPGTANGIINDVVVTHDKLNVLVPADGAAYIFPLESNLSQMSGAAMSGKTFTFGSNTTPTTVNKSVSGGSASFNATTPIFYTESSTPVVSSTEGVTMEAVFQYIPLAPSQQVVIYGKQSNSGLSALMSVKKFNGIDAIGVDFMTAGGGGAAFTNTTTALTPYAWYHVIGTWKTPDDSGNADNTVRLYVNGSLANQSGNFNSSGAAFDQTNTHIIVDSYQYVDYFAVYSYPYNGAYLNAAKRTRHYQAVLDGIDALTNTIQTPITAYGSASMPGGLFTKHADVTATALTASGEAVNPYEIIITHGQGGPMTASAEFVIPIGLGSVNRAAPALIAFGEMQDPTVIARKTVTFTAPALTASGLLDDPSFSAGTGHGAAHMNALADMGQATEAFILGIGRGNPMIATGLMVAPAITTELNAYYPAQTSTAKAKMITPPAYKLITDDIWYQKLFLQHSVVNGEKGYSTGSSAGAFLKLFDDVTSNISGVNTNKIINNLPRSIIIDTPTNTDTSIQYVGAINEFQTADPTPLLEVGTFDDYERKAVRFRNIQFEAPQDTYKGEGSYSLEFTFKSIKSNQVIAQGTTRSFYGNQNATSSIGLIDGKIFASRVTQRIDGSARIFAHPDNKDIASSIFTAYGNKRIDDGLWHHIIIQYGFDGRVQFWIDGQLDIQFFSDNKYGKGAHIRPYIIGSNHKNPRWQSDFETSAWSYDAAFFVDSQNITEHYTASIKYEPIHVTAITANAEFGQNSKAEGNRPRALMLYFWPTDTAQTVGNYNYIGFTSTESANELTTLDYFTKPPQEYEGWDVFPVDVTGYWVSDLVKKEAYGIENIGSTNFIQNVTPYQNTKNAPYALFNKRGTFRDSLTDAARYIDLINDIDLSKFDMIMFKNYPNDPKEKDAFTGAEVVDAYFNLRESKIFEDFVKSLRAAVDTGLSLMVANAQLALDLKIVDRVETVPDMDDNTGQGNYSDSYAPTQVPQGADLPIPPAYAEPLGWEDTWKNNRTRIVNTYPGITDYPALVRSQIAFWRSTDEFRWGGADRQFARYEHKDALAIGDEFVISTTGIDGNKSRSYLATPFANVKAGKIITAFANTVRSGSNLIENPYKNYAQSIIVSPGDVLDGRQVGGKIFVNFTEEINNVTESANVELSSVYWINYAYENEAISLTTKNELLAEDFVTTETPYWSLDGMHLLQQTGTQYELDSNFDKAGVQRAPVKVRKINKNGGLSFKSVASGGVYFSSTYAWQYPMALFEMPSMPTRGFRWLSNREVLEGTIIRPQAIAINASMPGGIAVPDKLNTSNAPAMIANAIIVETANNSGNVIMLVLPLTATATIIKPGSTLNVAPMIGNAFMFANNRAMVASEDQVVLQLIHVDPILYIREDVIK
jgi:hypothetical protein